MKKVPVDVVHLESGQKITVRMKSHRNIFFKFQNELSEWFSDVRRQRKLRDKYIVEGKVCAVFGSLGWHRALILERNSFKKVSNDTIVYMLG